MLPSVSTRVSEEVYKEQRTIADNKAITMVEAMDDLIMGYKMTIQKLQEEIKSLKVQQTQKKERKARGIHEIDAKMYQGHDD